MLPCVRFQNTERYSSYPVYHSVYETFEIVEKFYDPTFKRLHAVAQVRGGLIFLLADSQLLPLDVNQYADSLLKYALSISQLAQRHLEEMKRFRVSFGENGSFFLSTTSFLSFLSMSLHFAWNCIWLYPIEGETGEDLGQFVLFYVCRCLVFCCGEFHRDIQGLH